MMTVSNNNIIKVTRGDTVPLTFTVHNITNDVEVKDDVLLEAGDSLYFGLMEPNQPFERALIRMKVTAESDMTEVPLELGPEMTEFLLTGLYYYSVKIERKDGKVETLIKKTKFYILD